MLDLAHFVAEAYVCNNVKRIGGKESFFTGLYLFSKFSCLRSRVSRGVWHHLNIVINAVRP